MAKRKLLSKEEYKRRLYKSVVFALLLLVFSLGIGVGGYMYFFNFNSFAFLGMPRRFKKISQFAHHVYNK